MTDRIYSFGGGAADGSTSMKDLLGGKGANLAEMSSLGLPVPPGFTITSAVCMEYLGAVAASRPSFLSQHNAGKGIMTGVTWGAPPVEEPALPDGLMDEVRERLGRVEAIVGRSFGGPGSPLLVSVRSGARQSMPGMMDTILNLGLNDTTVEGLAEASGNPRFAWDSYRRFVTMYANVAMGLERAQLDAIVTAAVRAKGAEDDTSLTADDWRRIVPELKSRVAELKHKPFPDDAMAQLEGAIQAVFASWNTPRARFYRRENGFSDDWGTACSVQAMVFGNTGDDSATGVAFTRDPKNGDRVFFGEFLVNAQGEDVVAGLRTPQPINEEGSHAGSGMPTLQQIMPAAYDELVQTYEKLELHYRDMQDIEFTIEKGRLWILQTRTGKRTGAAAVRIAVDMANEGLATREEALRRVGAEQLGQLLHPTIDPDAAKNVVAQGLPASPGAATGKVVFHAEDAVRFAEAGDDVILVREETSPEDIHGMAAACGVLTARGGQTSHAAVVARGMGVPCVAGCKEIVVHERERSFTTRTGKGKEVTFHEGDVITLDGATGEIMLGEVAVSVPDVASSGMPELLGWADEVARLGVRANADTPGDAEIARSFGATGIGLCRTEHMFFDGDRIAAVREMILAEDEDDRQKALEKLYPMQRQDFLGIFEAMDGLPVTIRLLDPPLHEFLPHEGHEIEELARTIGVPLSHVRAQVESLRETNPMMGHRGCRLGLTFPSIYEMQVRAILDAALDAQGKGIEVQPEIMIPLVSIEAELERLRELVERTATQVFANRGASVSFKTGTMIELPRACLVADKVAKHADFFSFGTNDLTQTTFGFSRDDAGFLKPYQSVALQVLKQDPFVSIDTEGVGQLVKMGTNLGRSTKPGLKVGICGEHGGDPASIAFVHDAGLDYVSCSPFRVPVARLAAAHAALGDA
jgi:pyruvate, orthophosphate dikinase